MDKQQCNCLDNLDTIKKLEFRVKELETEIKEHLREECGNKTYCERSHSPNASYYNSRRIEMEKEWQKDMQDMQDLYGPL